MIGRTLVTTLVAGFLLVLTAITAAVAADETGAPAVSVPGELICMRDCVPACLAAGSGDDPAATPDLCERQCKRRCGVDDGATLRDVRRALDPVGDLTGAVGPSGIIVCGGAACVCSGAESCNSLIAQCPGDFVLQCNQFDDIGQPTGCSCIRLE